MERIVSREVMRKRDELTLMTFDMSSFDLMKKASKAMFDYMMKTSLINEHDHVVVVAGTGNNGGDGIVIASLLHSLHIDVSLVVVGDLAKQSPENKLALEEYLGPVHYVTQIENETKNNIKQATIIIDALFGIGIDREITGIYKEIIQYINRFKKQVISIDIPSGIHANNGLVMGVAIQATHTLVVQALKRGNILHQAKDYHGNIHVIDVGIVPVIGEKKEYLFQLTTSYYFEQRKHHSHKYHFGFTHVVGGSKGMMGAPILAAFAAYRTGTGLASISYPEEHLYDISHTYPEVMINTFSSTAELEEQLHKKTAIVFGPGLGRTNKNHLDNLNMILSKNIPTVIDADGIYYVKEIINELPHTNIVITPHVGELAYLCGVSSKDILQDPIKYVKELMRNYNLCIVLKGTTTIIAKDCEIYYSTIGSKGLATAGTGDVLAGIIGSLLGRGYKPLKASLMGVHIHSTASLLAEAELGEESMSASDLFHYLPMVIKRMKKKV